MEVETLQKNVTNILETLSQNRYKDSAPARLIAVTKTVSTAIIDMLKPLQVLDIAENRAQALLEKLPNIAPEFRLHWIGRLQTNKVKYIIRHVCLLHTLDRIALAQEVDRHAGMTGRVLPVLVQVNIAQEPQKTGLDSVDVKPFLQSLRGFPNIRVKGLMAMMPFTSDELQLTAWFQKMRTLFDQIKSDAIGGVHMEELSMGMSNDYEIAAREGATMVRVGSALFQP